MGKKKVVEPKVRKKPQGVTLNEIAAPVKPVIKLEINEAKEIINYLLAKHPEDTGKGIDRAREFIK